MTLPSGETVKAEEKFFVVRVMGHQKINGDNRNHDEQQIISAHHWWSEQELKTTSETVYPQNIVELLASIQSTGKK